MKTVFRFTAPLLVLAVVFAITGSAEGKGVRGLATITGTVPRQQGLPLAGRRDSIDSRGANQLVKQTSTAADGSFFRPHPRGALLSKAMLSVSRGPLLVSAGQRLGRIAYRFIWSPLIRAGVWVRSTRDRDNVKWVLRASRAAARSFQATKVTRHDCRRGKLEAGANENADVTESARPNDRSRVVHRESRDLLASSSNPFIVILRGPYFAVALPASERIDLIFAGRQGRLARAARFETSARVRVNSHHRAT